MFSAVLRSTWVRTRRVHARIVATRDGHRIAPFEYLIAFQQHHQDIALDLSEWRPWTYEALTHLIRCSNPITWRSRLSTCSRSYRGRALSRDRLPQGVLDRHGTIA
jgi:hypothetical protein